MKYIHCTV